MDQIKDKIIILGADHNGLTAKETIKKHLKEDGYVCIDIGSHEQNRRVDYVDYAITLAKIIDNGEAEKGILICGTGVGMSMVANRFKGVRASLVHNLETAHKTREHNDANVLCLGAWINSVEVNLEIVKTWLSEPFAQGRHVPRIEKFSGDHQHKVVFTNGIFDILHPGHIQLLKFAKSLGSRLIVGINSDRAVRILKGQNRPINNEQARKAILESLDCVDQVVIFDDVKTHDLIRVLKPDVLVKGGEWTAEEVRSRDQVPADIEIKICPLVEGFSTTDIIKKIEEQEGPTEYDRNEYDKKIIG